MNYLLAVVLIMAMFGIYGQTTFMTYKVAPSDTYSIEQSFQDKDVILTLNGKNIYLTTDMMSAIEGKSEGDLISATVIRNGEKKDIMVALREYTDFKNLEDNVLLYKALGIYYEIDDNGAMINGGLYSTSVKVGFFQTIGRSLEYSFKIAGTIFTVIGQLLTGSLGLTSMGGTVTTISVAADAIRIGGLRYFFNIASFIGVNLAVFNLLPIPALDGSRTVFTAVEWIRRKPLNRRVEAIIHGVGLVVLLLFSVCVDLLHCF
jgi:regulator of sigma E protease